MKITQNPDVEYAEEIRKKVKANGGYCPSQIEKNKNTKCKCRDFRTQVSNGIAGLCYCGLYMAQEET